MADWDAAVYVGPILSGVSNSLEKEMNAAGFIFSGLWGSGGSDVNSVTNPVYQFGLNRISQKGFVYSFLISSYKGHVLGLSNGYGDLAIDYAQQTSSFLFGVHSHKGITRISAGPSFHHTSLTTASYSSCAPVDISKIKVGFAIEAGLRFPSKSLIFFDFNTQYQYVGKQDLGTYDFGQSRTFEIGDKSSSYLCFNFGLGVRFIKDERRGTSDER